MRVKVIFNDLQQLSESTRRRLSESIRYDGPISSLELGKEYLVVAIAAWKDGLRFYIHDEDIDHPTPWPAEFFSVADGATPSNWRVCDKANGEYLISFQEWIADETFYERLINGDEETLKMYRKFKLTQ